EVAPRQSRSDAPPARAAAAPGDRRRRLPPGRPPADRAAARRAPRRVAHHGAPGRDAAGARRPRGAPPGQGQLRRRAAGAARPGRSARHLRRAGRARRQPDHRASRFHGGGAAGQRRATAALGRAQGAALQTALPAARRAVRRGVGLVLAVGAEGVARAGGGPYDLPPVRVRAAPENPPRRPFGARPGRQCRAEEAPAPARARAGHRARAHLLPRRRQAGRVHPVLRQRAELRIRAAHPRQGADHHFNPGGAVKLNDLERSMLAGEHGAAAKSALEHQVKVGEFFGAADFVPVTHANIMADTESLGEPGIAWLEALGRDRGHVRVPTITDPRGTDFAKTRVLGHPARIVELERRLIEAFKKLGVLMTDTCINYQTIQAPAPGESVAFGDTGVVIYANSVCGARSNYEGGPSAVAAGLTGRTPRYGFHLDEHRRATVKIRTQFVPKTLNEWGSLGGLIGRLAGDYWAVPYVEGLERVPGSDELKHFGAAMASFGSIAMFHLAGVTPEAVEPKLAVAHRVGQADVAA